MTPRLTAVAAAIACVFAAGQAQANGTDPTVVAGQASFSALGRSLSISNSPGAIINWHGFSIGAGETTRFIQQSAASSVLNRVIGPDPSSILGTLTSNGRVFLINPGGILFGPDARIDVAGLVASTLNLSNQDFLAGRFNFTSNPLAGKVENQGSITTPSGGSVYLVGSSVTNSGVINSPQGDVILAAGQSVKIFDSSTPGVRVELTASDNAAVNLGEILAQSGQVGIYGAALRNAGIIDANQVVRDASGKIVLRAKKDLTLEAGSRLSANGEQAGEITVQSETGTTLGSGMIEAKGTGWMAGKGGTIKLLGNMQTGLVNVGGTLDASAPNGGDGGFIETSAAHVKVADNTIVTTQSAQGKSGAWLIDPSDFTIAAAGGNITGTTLGTNLAGGPITILSSAGNAGGNGDINVNAAVSWSANALTLTAARDININAVMTASGTSSLLMNTATANGSDGAVAGGAVKVGMNAGGFAGRVDFFQANGVTPRTGTGFLTINGLGYTVIDTLGASTTTTVTDLQGMKSGLASNYALGANIDATLTSGWNAGAGFVPIGTPGTPFMGRFDGLGHTITALTIKPGSASTGLFGATGPNLTFQNIGLVGGSVIGAAGTGGLIGTNGTSSTVSNSYNTGNVSGAAGTGGLVGDNTTGVISNSFATGNVSGASGTGGLVGTNTTGAISNSYATGIVAGSNAGTGGLVGSNTTGTVSKSYASGSVTGGGAATGGLLGSTQANTVSDSYAAGNVSGAGAGVGGLIGSSIGTVTTSYATGSVSGAGSQLGALVGGAAGTVTTSFWNSDTSLIATSVGGGRGMTTAEMKTQANFTSATTANGSVDPAWNSTNTWVMYNGLTYPLLRPFMTPLTVTANNDTKTYNGLAYSGGNGVTPAPSGNLLGTVSYSGTSQGAINANSYVITPGGLYSNQQGYIISYADGTLNITKKSVTIAGTVADTKVYNGDTLATLSNIGAVATGVGTETLVLTGPSAGNINFNTKDVATANLVTGAGYSIGDGTGTANNYALSSTSATAAAAITTKALTGSISAANKPYDTTTSATITGRTLAAGVLGSEVVSYSSGTASFDTKNVGTSKTVTATGLTLAGADAGNYTVNSTATTTADLAPAPLGIAANSTSKTYGSTVSFSGTEFSSTGLKSGETVGSVSLTSAGAVATAGAGGSPYDITASAATGGTFNASNYTIVYVNGKLSVAPAPLDIAANSATRLYGNANPAFSAAYTGFQNGETATALTGALAFATPAIPSSNVGNYTTTPSGQSSANYTISYVNGALTVIPVSLVVAADAKSKIYGAADPALTFATTGLVNNPALGIADTAVSVLSGALLRVPGESAVGGPYAITQGSLAANSNYTLGFTRNDLLIIGAAAEPILGLDPGQVILAGVINSETNYRPGNFWHIALNPNNADPGFDVMRGTDDSSSLVAREGAAPLSGFIGRSGRRQNDCGSVSAGGFCETWSFPQQRQKANKK